MCRLVSVSSIFIFSKMAEWRHVFCVTILIIKFTTIWTQLQCPENCVCTSYEAECNDMKSLTPFPDHVVNMTIQGSSLKRLGPNSFGRGTQYVHIIRTDIDEISSSAFSSLFSVQSIHFSSVFIRTIKKCAFSDIRDSGVIKFSESKINLIEPGAFSHIVGINEINFTLSTINHIDSFAFSDIQTEKMSVLDSEIFLMSTSAFESIRDVNLFSLNKVTMATVKAGAFSNVSSFKKVLINRCMFENIECNAVMELREATSRNDATFVFTNSDLSCNCSTLAMLGYVTSNKNAVTDSVLCIPTLNGTLTTRKPLVSVSRSSICPQLQFPKTCSYETPPLPSCAVAPTDTESTDKTEFKTSTTQTDQDTTIDNKGSKHITAVELISILVVASLSYS